MNTTFVTYTDGPLQAGKIAEQDSALLDAYSRTMARRNKVSNPLLIQVVKNVKG